MEIDPRRHLTGPAQIIANLPYNVGTALLVGWMSGADWPPWWSRLTLMFQKEVAERITAAPGDGAYGRLSVLAQWRATAKIAFEVSPRVHPGAESDVRHSDDQPGRARGGSGPAYAGAGGRGGVRTTQENAAPEPQAAWRSGAAARRRRDRRRKTSGNADAHGILRVDQGASGRLTPPGRSRPPYSAASAEGSSAFSETAFGVFGRALRGRRSAGFA